MTIYATGNPVGSTNPKDLIDNAQNLDYLILGPALSYPDRGGVNRLSWAGIEASFAAAQAQRATDFTVAQNQRANDFTAAQSQRANDHAASEASRGYENPVPYAASITLTRVTQLVQYNSELYKARAGTLPWTTTGLWATDSAKLVSVGDAALRQELGMATGRFLIGKINTIDYWAARMHGGEAVNITVYGDSTTDGTATTGWTANPTTAVTGQPWTTAPVANSDHNAEAPNAWPVKLQKVLRDYHRNSSINVYNAGYSGQQMQNGWANFYFQKAVLQNPFIPAPDIVLIGFGLNDITDAGNRVAQHIAETMKVVQQVLVAGATPVLVTCDANWRSFKSWSSGSSGRDNEESSAEIDAAKKFMAEAYGIPIIDQSNMQRLWMSKNSDYSNQSELQADGLHWGDAGHSMKAAYAAQCFMPDIVHCKGTDIERLCWMDSRARYTKGDSSSWIPPSGTEGFKYSRFPRVWYVNPTDYSPGDVIIDAYVWSEGNQDSVIYRNFGNSNVDNTVAQANLPTIKIYASDSSTPYYSKELPGTGAKEAYGIASDRPFYVAKLRYGLNRIQIVAPLTNASIIWGGWLEFNPFWKAKDTFGYFNNYGAPSYIQVNALEKTGPLDYRFLADTTNNRVAFLMPEIADGTNSADIGQVGDQIEILVDGFFDTDTGFLFFGGKSLNRTSGSPDNYSEDNCLLLYAQPTTFDLLQLRYPYQASAPFPTIQTGIPGAYSSGGARKFRIVISKTAPTVQTVNVYDGWVDEAVPVLSYAGGWSQGNFCGAGVIGGAYATRNINRSARINQLIIRKYK